MSVTEKQRTRVRSNICKALIGLINRNEASFENVEQLSKEVEELCFNTHPNDLKAYTRHFKSDEVFLSSSIC